MAVITLLSFNFGPIPTRFGMKVGHGPLKTGKILRSGYLGKGCYGDEKTLLILRNSLDWVRNVPGGSIMDGSKFRFRPLGPVSIVTGKCQFHRSLYHAPYMCYQCANPSIIVRLHDQGASNL